MGSIDQNNSYVFPLNAGESFTGIYSSTTNFSEILISVETDTTFNLTINFSSNGLDIGLVKSYNVVVPSEGAFTYSLTPYLRYFQVVLQNTGIDQSYLRLETILKSSVVYQETSGVISSDVNIVSPLVNGNVAINLQAINGDYLQDNQLLVSDNTSQFFLNGINSNTYVIATNTYTRGNELLWDDLLGATMHTQTINLSSIQVKLISIYGLSTDDTVLTLVYSPDNVNFFNSQYQIPILANQSFGFSVASNPAYLCISSTNLVNKLTIYISYS